MIPAGSDQVEAIATIIETTYGYTKPAPDGHGSVLVTRWEAAARALIDAGRIQTDAKMEPWSNVEAQLTRLSDAGVEVKITPSIPESSLWRVTVRRSGESAVLYETSLTAVLADAEAWAAVLGVQVPPAETEG